MEFRRFLISVLTFFGCAFTYTPFWLQIHSAMSRRSRLSREELEVNEALSDSESGDGLPPAPGQSVRRSSPASVRSRVATPPPPPSISRWIREVLSLAGIDVGSFGPGSTRGASASVAAKRSAYAEQIMKAGSWSNLGTFQRFYERHVDDTPVGHLILQEANVSSF